ncbi:hypothetical protein [Gulosibacter sp. 10]|uniref:hypothetical protein n=1 Tax=Gulosibacter sp. 10 TaxID=1255570 RepID=UPI00097F339B|nr:hypothetical protein [Gulosibacter sp. 10]SJM54585.1 hypothetical protein FM112_03635 [Gulosibacter sp. 10]
MRKYLLNGALISAVAGIIPTLKRSQDADSKGSAILQWVAWGVAVGLAVMAVREQAISAREDDELER